MSVSRENALLPEEMVLEYLCESAPDSIPHTKRVGHWLWIMFPEKPPEQTRIAIKEIGFRFSKRRSAWLHPCGHPCSRPARGYDPRDKYGVQDVEEK